MLMPYLRLVSFVALEARSSSIIKKGIRMLARIFGSVRREYLIRAYVIGLVMFGFFVFMDYQIGWPEGFFWKRTLPAFICALLFPFSKPVYDELNRFALGDNVFFFNAIAML